MKNMEWQAILFDFDGVLVDTEWAIYTAWRDIFSTHGQQLHLEIYTQCIGSDFQTWSPKTYLEELTGMHFDWEKIDIERQKKIVAELADEGAMPGAIPLLEQLKTSNIPLAVVSSSSHHWVDGWLERLGMRGYFTEVICRGDAPRIKPAPDLWNEALRRLDCSAEKCLAIEDSQNGLISAKAARLSVWIAPNRVTSCLAFTEADRIFPDFGTMASSLFARCHLISKT